MKNILFVSQCDFPSNSAVHVHHFANELVTLGFDCVVAVPHTKETIAQMRNPLYKVIQFNQVEGLTNLFENQQPPDIVHAWTPRERVRRFCALLEESFRFKLVIHLEDNETVLLERFANRSMVELLRDDVLIHNDLSHPRKHQEFLNSADGVTVIIDRLQELVLEQVPCVTIWPGVDAEVFFPRPVDATLVSQLGIPVGSTVLCYTGNIHSANVAEVKSLYRAVGKRNLENKPTVLVRTGIKPDDFLSSSETWIEQYVIELGFIERAQVPEILAIADVLIQPGVSDPFNDYRFPSKIPEFLAMGKPVIIPETNIGRFLTHKENAIILPIVDETSLSDAIDMILHDPALAQKLGQGAVAFAKNYLNWREKGECLKEFYQQVYYSDNNERSIENAFRRVQRWTGDLHEEMVHNQIQLKQIQVDLEQIQLSLEQSQRQLQSYKDLIRAMESSKFWKLRTYWFRLKSILKGKRP